MRPSAAAVVGPLLDLDAQPAARVGLGGAGDAAVEAVERDRAHAAGQPDALDDLGDGADVRVLVLVRGTSSTRSSSPTSIGQRDGHVREDDGVFEWNEQQSGQRFNLLC